MPELPLRCVIQNDRTTQEGRDIIAERISGEGRGLTVFRLFSLLGRLLGRWRRLGLGLLAAARALRRRFGFGRRRRRCFNQRFGLDGGFFDRSTRAAAAFAAFAAFAPSTAAA